MMPVGKLARMVVGNTVRSPKHFVLSSFGITIGIAAFVFLLALVMGVRSVIVKVFPLEEVEVIAPRTSFGTVDTTAKLRDDTVATLAGRAEVRSALPRMALPFSAYGFGSFEGNPIKFEVGGFADGIDPAFLADDAYLSTLFKDWDSDPAPRVACAPRKDALPGVKWTNPCPDPERYYCDETTRTCHHRVPVVVSPALLEVYNAQIAPAQNLPVIDKDVAAFIAKRSLSRLSFTIGLGDTVLGGKDSTIPEDRRRQVEAVLIGVSPKAMPLGMTMPIQYIRRWNQEYLGDDAASTYSSIVVTLKDKDRLALFSSYIENKLGLRLKDSLGERFATAIFVVGLVFFFISLLIVSISAINITHNFFMQVSERRRELGVLRAVGATPGDIQLIILGETALIGVISGLLGLALARGGAWLADWAVDNFVPVFPFKPTSLFAFEWWIVASALGLSVIFCVSGGFLPARRAAQMQPAQALAQN